MNECDTGRGGYTIYIAPGVYPEQVDIGVNDGRAAKSGKPGMPNRLVADTTGASTGLDAGPVVIEGGGTRACGIVHAGTDYWTFEGFTIRGQTRANIDIDDAKGCRIEGCDLLIAPEHGILAQDVMDLAIEGNTLRRDAASGHGVRAEHAGKDGFLRVNRNRVHAEGSLLGASGFGTGAGLGLRSAGDSGIILVGGNAKKRTEIECTNNIVSDGYYGIYCQGFRDRSTANLSNNTVTECHLPLSIHGTFVSARLHNNLIADNYFSIYVDTPGASVRALLDHGSTLAAHGVAGGIPGLVTGDPRFGAAASGDFRPSAGSPAIDSGIAEGAPATDLLGVARAAGGIDIGALEGGAAARSRPRIVSWRGPFRTAREGREPGRGVLEASR